MIRISRIAILIMIAVIQFKTVALSDPVTLKGVSNEYLNSYLEGAASVFRVAGNLEYIQTVSQDSALELGQFLYINSYDSIVKFDSITDASIVAYVEGSRIAAQLVYLGDRKTCIPIEVDITRAEVKQAIDYKFTGEFDGENLNILLVGALERLSELFPCN